MYYVLEAILLMPH